MTMDISVLFKVVGVALVVTAAHQILSRCGRDEQATLVSIAGVITVLVLLIGQFSELLQTIRGLFDL